MANPIPNPITQVAVQAQIDAADREVPNQFVELALTLTLTLTLTLIPMQKGGSDGVGESFTARKGP